MSMIVRMGVKSFAPALVLSIFEILIFAALSIGYFWLLNVAYAAAFDTATPAWLWIVASIVYLILLCIWWAPGDETTSKAEVWALAIVAVIALSILVVWQWGPVSSTLNTFKDVMASGGRTRVGTPASMPTTAPAAEDTTPEE